LIWSSSGGESKAVATRTRGSILAACLILTAVQKDCRWDYGPQLSSWPAFARNAQHTAISPVSAQSLARVHWHTPVDLAPQYSSSALLAHYGSPLVTARNTVLVPVKTGATGGFGVEARSGTDGHLIWMAPTDYTLPSAPWTPIFGPVLIQRFLRPRLYFPGAGGTVYFRDDPDSASGAEGQIAFYGLDTYSRDQALFDANVTINTPLTANRDGGIYFGFIASGSLPGGLKSGIAYIDPDGHGTWIPVTTAAADTAVVRVATNSAPALSTDFRTVYAAVSNGLAGYLVALDSQTLQPRARVRLLDPATGLDAYLSDNASASPTIGPDGDVYFGVLESSYENHGRGWLLHFDAELLQSKTPGAFGWDTTPSVVPLSMVPSYSGTSSYLLMTKYNDYLQEGGSGLNRIAILDPNTAETDPVTGVAVMNVVLSVAGVTPAGPPPAVKDWCVNSAAVDPATKSVFAGSSDGKLYRWDLPTNTLAQAVVLTSGLGEAYTPTLIGADGTVYAISNATLFAVGSAALARDTRDVP
jgi:hypothetical protein